MTALRPGQRFYARVRARNAEGDSPWTPFFEIQTPPDVPMAPGPPTLTPVAPHSLHVSWAPPADNGSPVTLYHVQVCRLPCSPTQASARSNRLLHDQRRTHRARSLTDSPCRSTVTASPMIGILRGLTLTTTQLTASDLLHDMTLHSPDAASGAL